MTDQPTAPVITIDRPWTDADVDRYALVIAAAGGDDRWITGERKADDVDSKILLDDYRGDSRAILYALHEDGRLCPADTMTRLAELEAAVQRVRDLCDRALADDGTDPVTGWEDPTPLAGWTTAVLNALEGSCERGHATPATGRG